MFGRYKVPDVPRQGYGAFMPAPPPVVTRAEVSSWGLVHVSGAPGTLPVPSPKPTTSGTDAIGSDEAKTAGSNNAPDVFLPSIYVASVANMGPRMGALGIRVRNTNDIPMPAVNIMRAPAVAQRTPTKLGGRRVTPWPRVFTRWPSVTEPGSAGPRW